MVHWRMYWTSIMTISHKVTARAGLICFGGIWGQKKRTAGLLITSFLSLWIMVIFSVDLSADYFLNQLKCAHHNFLEPKVMSAWNMCDVCEKHYSCLTPDGSISRNIGLRFSMMPLKCWSLWKCEVLSLQEPGTIKSFCSLKPLINY